MIDDRLGDRLSTNYTIWFVLEKLKTRIVIVTREREREISVKKRWEEERFWLKKNYFILIRRIIYKLILFLYG
jgi:hypothetical protein